MTDQPEKIIHDLMTQAVEKQDGVIVQIMKDCGIVDVPMKDIVRHISGNGVETWSYKDKAFARMFPFEFRQVTDGRTIKLIATQRIERLGYVVGV